MKGLVRVPVTRRALAAHIDFRGPHRRTALRARIAEVILTLTSKSAELNATRDLLGQLELALTPTSDTSMWLALAVVAGRLPDEQAVIRAVRLARLDGPLAALAETLTLPVFPPPMPGGPWPTVTVVTDRVLIDLHDTALTDLATGIQRVARQTAARWQRDHAVSIVGWTRRSEALRELTVAQTSHALLGLPDDRTAALTATSIIVPWHCRYVLPELIIDPVRNQRLRSLLRFSGNTGSNIGFDLVPITSAETAADGMGYGFATALTATAYMTATAAISAAAAAEYRGWRQMLTGAGLHGPEIRSIELATEAIGPSPAAIARARTDLMQDGLPMVLCVGSHEPRKNHLAVLHAADLLWRAGIQFSLVFIGGNSWRSEQFSAEVERLQIAGRPILSKRALTEDQLWAAYRLARCVVFPSLNEGFGLPVAEALASGTPVITSRFGSMRELSTHGGVLLVDPRNDHDLADGLRRLLIDDELYADLVQQAQAVPVRSWDDYAAETWQFLIEGGPIQ